MFDDIEREYKKDLQGKRFVTYYWPRALAVILVAVLLDLVLGKHRWLVYGFAVLLFVVFAAIFFLKEYYHAHRTMESVRQGKSLTTKMTAYFKVDDTKRIEKLVADLRHHNLHTKSDVKLTLDYFQSRLPVNSRPNLSEWIFTTVIALSSIVIITYDNSINTISLHKLFAVFAPSVAVALIILTPFILAKLILAGISKSHNKIDTSLVQDLAYIYVHFEKYEKKLAANNS